MNLKYKHILEKPFTIGYSVLMCIGFLLTIGRWLSVFENEFIMISESFHYSVSNLSLSLIFYLAIGLSWLKFGVKFNRIALLGLFIVASNLICETVVRFMNTPDIVDAIYGIVGTGIAFVFLYSTSKYGLIPIINEN